MRVNSNYFAPLALLGGFVFGALALLTLSEARAQVLNDTSGPARAVVDPSARTGAREAVLPSRPLLPEVPSVGGYETTPLGTGDLPPDALAFSYPLPGSVAAEPSDVISDPTNRNDPARTAELGEDDATETELAPTRSSAQFAAGGNAPSAIGSNAPAITSIPSRVPSSSTEPLTTSPEAFTTTDAAARTTSALLEDLHPTAAAQIASGEAATTASRATTEPEPNSPATTSPEVGGATPTTAAPSRTAATEAPRTTQSPVRSSPVTAGQQRHPTAAAVRTTTTTTTAAPRTTTTAAPRTTTTTAAPRRTTTTAVPRTTTTAAPNAASAVHVSTNGSDSNNGSSSSPVASFERALQIADPGEPIVFAPGQYNALRLTDIQGSRQNPIQIVGSPGVEFRSGSYSREAGILVRNSSNIEIIGVSVRHALWGVYIDNAHGISLLNSDIRDIGQEIVRIKGGSSDILVEGNTIADSGRRTDNSHANGEGVYIGTGTPSNVDRVTDVTVRNNVITRLTDEAIDIKIPSTNVTIVGNTITDVHTQTTGAVVIHLNSRTSADSNILIDGNTISDVTRSTPYLDGNCIVAAATATIQNNTISNCQHRGIFVQGSAGTATVRNNNLSNTGSIGGVVDGGSGLSLVASNNVGG